MTKLITDEQHAQLLANGRQSLEQENFDPAPVVRLFTPDAGATWLLTEVEPDDHDHAFGLCDLGLGYPELGWVSLPEPPRTVFAPDEESGCSEPAREPQHRGFVHAGTACELRKREKELVAWARRVSRRPIREKRFGVACGGLNRNS